MTAMLLSPEDLRDPLLTCGYRAGLFRTGFSFGEDQIVPIVAFAQAPLDSRSACIAVLSATDRPRLAVENCRRLGAPIVFVCFQDTLQWWKQGVASAEYLESIPAPNINRFFEVHQRDFSPDVVYRAKTWGRFRTEYQLSFVDLGLMPLVEEQVGNSLATLIENNVSDLKSNLQWNGISDQQGHWLLQTIFWLVSGKILGDKQVESFQDLDLTDVDEVFRRLAHHYGTDPVAITSAKKREALQQSARAIARFSSLALTTTESLAHVYENALISEETRSSLGTHSTPAFLVDYVMGNLADWITEIPVSERVVFEPACGHAAFLVSAMRLLTELLPGEMATPKKRGQYLRSRLHGNDIDPFALELARLSLTLTDIPNPDGWDLSAQDMFVGDQLSRQARKSTVLLANPPFDNFTAKEQGSYRSRGSGVRFLNKAAEMLWRTVQFLPVNAVFGVVLPQTFLHSENARELRKSLLQDYELREICLFPDKVFSFSEAESAVIVGRRWKQVGYSQVAYRHVRERELPFFRAGHPIATPTVIPQLRFIDDQSFSLRVPDLEDVWRALADNPTLADFAVVGQGLEYRGVDLPSGASTYSEHRFQGSERGFVRFERGVQLHELPKTYWMNLAPAVIRRPVSGTTVSVPQVLLNYARTSRGPWRLKALIDREGHPVTSRFIVVRPKKDGCSLETLWAVLNSPLANAYAYSHLSKRDNVVGDIRKILLPKTTSYESTDRAARAYIEAARSGANPQKLRQLLLEVDVEVLKLYSLPVELEQSVLNLFTDWERAGVPFRHSRYLPKELGGRLRLSEFVEFEQNWLATNRERGKLIDKNIAGTLTSDERERLDALQAYADYHIEKVAVRPMFILDEIENRLFIAAPARTEHT